MPAGSIFEISSGDIYAKYVWTRILSKTLEEYLRNFQELVGSPHCTF